MRIGLIADIHGNVEAFKSVLSQLDKTADKILFAGDLAGYFPYVNECIDLWDNRRIIAVCGNHDRLLLDWEFKGIKPSQEYMNRFGKVLTETKNKLSIKAKNILKVWPEKVECRIGAQSILMTHGSPWDKLDGRIYPDFKDWENFSKYNNDIIILGHTHYPMYKIWKSITIINPGSVGQPRDGIKAASYAIIDIPRIKVSFYRM